MNLPFSSLVLDPIWPLPILLALGGVLAAVTLAAYFKLGSHLNRTRNLFLVIFRLGGISLLILLLAQPSRYEEIPPPALEKNLMEYSRSRTAASELAGNIISLSAGASVFGKMTPGALTVGGGLAAAIAQQTAISNFILGPTPDSSYAVELHCVAV